MPAFSRAGGGGTKSPGEFRRSQNWIGGTRPGNAPLRAPAAPRARRLPGRAGALHAREASQLPALIKAGLLHVQFETIHPFLDGNGRIGRLLVTLYLCDQGVLRSPLLYLSLFLKAHRADYYRLLQEVRERGAWEAWLEFFLDGVAETANGAFDAATRIVNLFKADRERIVAESDPRQLGTARARPSTAEPLRHGQPAGATHRAERAHSERRAGRPGAARHCRRDHRTQAGTGVRLPAATLPS
jgi:Fic family protein